MPTSENPPAPAGGSSNSPPVVPSNTSPDAAVVQALSLSLLDAVNQQQQMAVTAQAALTMGIASSYSINTASTGRTTSKILGQ